MGGDPESEQSHEAPARPDKQLWQTAPNGGWSSWSSLGQPSPNVKMFTPSVAANADGRLVLFVPALGGELWHVWQTAPNGEWSDWSSFGHPVSPLNRPLAVAANADGRLELFVTVQNGELYHLWQTAPNNGWSGWSSFAVPPGTTLGDWLAVAANADGRLEFFIEDFSGAWWNQWQTAPNNGWSGWSPVVGAPTTPEGVPSVAPNADGRLEFFIIDQSGALWHQAQTAPNNGWSNWASFGPAPPGLEGLPATALNADGRLEFFIPDISGAVWHQWKTAPDSDNWSGWSTFGMAGGVRLLGTPGVGLNADGRLELFMVGNDGALWHQAQTAPSNGWSGWSSLGSPPGIQLAND